ncbi:Imidazole glycerol phosphate synthase subunit HisH 1 [compost metagenome]
MFDVSIVDYGVGNIASVGNMVKRLGFSFNIVGDSLSLREATRIILPGVGAFDSGMTNLNELGLRDGLNFMALEKKVPILGICLGAQLLGFGSEEGRERGLGWIDFECQKFQSMDNLKVPHMGWNYVTAEKESVLSKGISDGRFYFVHSYFMKPKNQEDILFSTVYGKKFAAAVAKDNIYGVQFHPEKSHKFGLQLMKNFLEIC